MVETRSRWLLGGQPCLDPLEEADNLRRLRWPEPPHFRRANGFWCPLGREPGRGWVLMQKKHLDLLTSSSGSGINGEYNLQIIQDNTNLSVTVYNLCVVRWSAVTPSGELDLLNRQQTCFLVELADARHFLASADLGFPINKGYNLRARGWSATAFYDDSRNAGSDWTWDTMVGDIWNHMEPEVLSTYPGLPYTPHGTPEGWHFPGVSAWDALNAVLDRLDCAFKINPLLSTGAHSIVALGAADSAHTALVAANGSHLIFDRQIATGQKAGTPRAVRVFFHKLSQYAGQERTTDKDSDQWVTAHVHSIDKTGSDTTTTLDGTKAILWDDLPALVDHAGAVQNSSALDDRATERQDKFYQAIDASDYSRKIYRYPLPFVPGSVVKGVAWYMDLAHCLEENFQGHVVTEVINQPGRNPAVVPSDGAQSLWGLSVLHNTPVRPPWARFDLPIYPELGQVIEIVNGTPSSGRYDSKVVIRNAAGSWSDGETVYALDLRGASSLSAGNRYEGRLSSYEGSRPLYVIDSGGTGGSSWTLRTVDGTPSVSGVNTVKLEETHGFVLVDEGGGVARVEFNLTVREDTSPVYNNIATIIFDEDEFALSQPSANTVKVNALGGGSSPTAGCGIAVTGSAVRQLALWGQWPEAGDTYDADATPQTLNWDTGGGDVDGISSVDGCSGLWVATAFIQIGSVGAVTYSVQLRLEDLDTGNMLCSDGAVNVSGTETLELHVSGVGRNLAVTVLVDTGGLGSATFGVTAASFLSFGYIGALS